MERQEFFIVLGQTLFAIFGACVKWLNIKDSMQQRLLPLLIECATAAFSGVLVFLIYKWLGLNVYVAFALAGVIGNSGAKGIDMLGKIIMSHPALKGANIEDKDKKDGPV